MSTAAVALILVTAIGQGGYGDDPKPPPPTVTGTASSNSFLIDSAQKSEAANHGGPGSGASAPSEPAIVIGGAACEGAEPLQDSAQTSSGATYCTASVSAPTVTIADVQKAFGELKLAPGTLVIQPPDGLTLVNFETNFYTTATAPIAKTVTLLGQQVTLEATPATYTWHFGDGTSTSTTEPGAAYPDLTITHDYQRTGDYGPSLSTTYTGRYRVGDGPWQTIPGTVTIDGPAQPLRAIEAQPKLVGY